MILQELNVHGCALVSDTAFALRVNHSIRVLNVSETLVKGDFYRQSPMLTELHCSDCPNMKEDSRLVLHLLNHPNVLESLSLENTRWNAVDLLALSTKVPQLGMLRLSLTNADDAVVRSFVANCPYLRYFTVRDCAAVTQATVDELKQSHRPRLNIFR